MSSKERRIFRKERHSFPDLHHIIRQTKEEVNLGEKIKKEMIKKILMNEKNSMKFYDIVIPPNLTPLEEFKSIHQYSASNIKSIKLFTEDKFSGRMEKVRKELKKRPDGSLLLSEMYILCKLVTKSLKKVWRLQET